MMTDEDRHTLIRTLKDRIEEIKNDPVKARQLLFDAGIYTEEGDLAYPYKGGTDEESKVDLVH